MDNRQLQDRAEISDTIYQFARALDTHDWALCRACFTDEIETDYADLRGEPPATVRADDYVASRRAALQDLKTLHTSANHQITLDGDNATCVSCIVIYRFLPNGSGDNTFHTYAYYTHNLKRTSDGWKIYKVKQTVIWNTGNPSIHGMHRQSR